MFIPHLQEVLEERQCSKFEISTDRYRFVFYLLAVHGDPSIGLYGEDGNKRGTDGEILRTITREKAITISTATAEIVSFQYFLDDEEPYNANYEMGKIVYRGKNGPYIEGPRDYKKKISLDSFR